jgi:hypothetical protein
LLLEAPPLVIPPPAGPRKTGGQRQRIAAWRKQQALGKPAASHAKPKVAALAATQVAEAAAQLVAALVSAASAVAAPAAALRSSTATPGPGTFKTTEDGDTHAGQRPALAGTDVPAHPRGGHIRPQAAAEGVYPPADHHNRPLATAENCKQAFLDSAGAAQQQQLQMQHRRDALPAVPAIRVGLSAASPFPAAVVSVGPVPELAPSMIFSCWVCKRRWQWGLHQVFTIGCPSGHCAGVLQSQATVQTGVAWA